MRFRSFLQGSANHRRLSPKPPRISYRLCSMALPHFSKLVLRFLTPSTTPHIISASLCSTRRFPSGSPLSSDNVQTVTRSRVSARQLDFPARHNHSGPITLPPEYHIQRHLLNFPLARLLRLTFRRPSPAYVSYYCAVDSTLVLIMRHEVWYHDLVKRLFVA